jgi:deoxyribodipyrimidine photolyase-related protein
MSNYCADCRYRPDRRDGPDACPFTVLYWHFLDRNERGLAANPRTGLMARRVAHLRPDERRRIRASGDRLLADLDRVAPGA